MSALPAIITEEHFLQKILRRDDLPENIRLKVCNKYSDSSNWDPASWPPTMIGAVTSINKGQVKSKYLLNGDDIKDLPYMCWVGPRGYVSKNYYRRHVETRAWEKYGGPTGLQAALGASKQRTHGARNGRQVATNEANPTRSGGAAGRIRQKVGSQLSQNPVAPTTSTISRSKAGRGETFSSILQPPASPAALFSSQPSGPACNNWRGSSPTVVGSSSPSLKRAIGGTEIIEVTDSEDEWLTAKMAPPKKKQRVHSLVGIEEVIDISD